MRACLHALVAIAVMPLTSLASSARGAETLSTEPNPISVAGAFQAADVVLKSLQNWSAPGVTGASWVEEFARSGAAEAAVRGSIGGAPPKVSVGSIEVKLQEAKGSREPSYFSVELDLQIVSEDGMVVAASMLEDFMEAFDELNGPLDVKYQRTELLSATKTLRVFDLVVEVQLRDPLAAAGMPRPLTEIARRVEAAGIPAGALGIELKRRVSRQVGYQDFLHLSLGGKGDGLSGAACGELLRCLGDGDNSLSITEISISKGKDDDQAADQWRLAASVLARQGRG